MNRFPPQTVLRRWWLAIALLFVLALTAFYSVVQTMAAQVTQAVFLPIMVHIEPPEPVSTVVAQIALDGAQCPNDIAVNQQSGYVYVANEESDNVSILFDNSLVQTMYTGDWPIRLAADPRNDSVYMTHVLGEILRFEGTDLVSRVTGHNEPYNMVVNEANGYLYISDLHDRITIMDGDTIVAHVPLTNAATNNTIPWNLAADYDTQTGHTYFAAWDERVVTVMDGLTVVDQFDYGGQGAWDMVIDSYRRKLYIANTRGGEGGGPTENATVVDLATGAVTPIYTAQKSHHVALDPTSGYAYFTDFEDGTVTVVDGSDVKAVVTVGEKPWHVFVDPATSYVYVTNADSNTISVIKGTTVVDTIALPAGSEPWKLAMNETTRALYVLNRSSYIYLSEVGTRRLGCDTPYVLVIE